MLKKITILSLFFVYVNISYAQEGMNVLQGESYLDGFEVYEILGVPSLGGLDKQVVSYLDDIVSELTMIEQHYINTDAINGVYNSLDDCMFTARANHLPLAIAEDKIALAKRKLFKAIRNLFPSINLSYSHDKGFKLYKDDPDKTDSVDESQRFRSEQIRASFSQSLFKGGALWNQVKYEKENLAVAKYELKKVNLDLTLEVARAYLNLVNAKTIYKLKHNLVMKTDALDNISKEKMEAGLISEVENLNVSSQIVQLQHDLEAAKEDYELNLIEFKKVLHIDINETVTVKEFSKDFIDKLEMMILDSGNIDDKDKDEAKLKELEKKAYENRPEFMIQKHKLLANKTQEKINNAGWLPQIDLVAEFGQKAEAYTSVDNNPPWDEEHHIGIQFKWNFGGNTMNYTYDKNRQGTGVEATDINVGQDGYYDRKNNIGVSVLDGLEQFAVTKEAEIKRKESMLELEVAEKDIVSEVKEAYYAYNRAKIKLKATFKKIKYREKLAKLAKHRSEVNEIQLSEYLQAEVDLMKETETLIQTIVEYLLSKVSLNKAIGVKDYLPLTELNKQ